MGAAASSRGRKLSFPDGFVWGTATSAYQVEGATSADGRGESVWDTFAGIPGAIAHGHTADTAADHYHRYADDVRLMADLGLSAYRFSVAWPRVQPTGAGPANRPGLDFYSRLVDELLGAGITPYATLYHWDLPQALEDRGGWTVRPTAERFAEFAHLVHARIGDRVDTWFTLNEPWVVSVLGHATGQHAPGRASPGEAYRAAHHLLLGHGLAARALRDGGAATVGLTLNLAPVLTPDQLDDPGAPASAADAVAVRQVDALLNRQFLDPVVRGRYPDEVLAAVEESAGLGHVRHTDLAVINQVPDLLGVNYYWPRTVRAEDPSAVEATLPGLQGVAYAEPLGPRTAMGWPIAPAGLRQLLDRLARDYPGLPLLVTENGAAFEDTVTEGGVHDGERTAYLEGHLRAAHAAVEAGVDLRGYLVWSLLDNFEWVDGFTKRFGIVHVDFATQQRLPKDSAAWFAGVVRRNALGQEPSARPTLEAVAARAGVSRATASRVVAGGTRVSAATRAVVERAVADLGYVPNSAARSLVTREADEVALVLADPGPAGADDWLSVVTRAAARELQRAGHRVGLRLVGGPWDAQAVLEHVSAGHLAGALLVGGELLGSLPADLAGHGVPAVSLGPVRVPAVPSVDADHAGGAAAAVAHLLALGCRQVVALGGPGEVQPYADRVAGYRRAVDAAGMPAVVAGSDLTGTSVEAAVAGLLGDHPDLDAVFAVTDEVAVAAIAALRSGGRAVPEDVAVVGFGDAPAARFAHPPLSTVRVRHAELGAVAGRMLLEHLDGQPVTTRVLPVELVLRASG